MKTKLKILIVDDSLSDIKYFSNSLKNINATIDSAQSANEALELVKENNYALIISDIMMPEINGLEFLNKLQSLKCYNNVPVMFRSNMNLDENIIDKAYKVGAIDLISKEENPQILQSKIESFLKLTLLKNLYNSQIKDNKVQEKELLVEEQNLHLKIEKARTERLELEEEIAEVNQNAVYAETETQEKNQFLVSIKNQLGNPLNDILKDTQDLLKSEISIDQKETLESIELSCNALDTILGDIFDISKIEAGEINIKYKPFNLIKTLKDVKSLMSNKLNPNVEFILNYNDNIPNSLMGDFGRIRQIITNLISNAAKFTEQGSVTLSAKIQEQDEFSTDILFEVIDTGIGIDKDKIDKVFEKFTQETDSTARHYGGTGLGLPICKQLTQAMGGELILTSEKGKGSTFSFLLSFDLEEGV